MTLSEEPVGLFGDGRGRRRKDGGLGGERRRRRDGGLLHGGRWNAQLGRRLVGWVAMLPRDDFRRRGKRRLDLRREQTEAGGVGLGRRGYGRGGRRPGQQGRQLVGHPPERVRQPSHDGLFDLGAHGRTGGPRPSVDALALPQQKSVDFRFQGREIHIRPVSGTRPFLRGQGGGHDNAPCGAVGQFDRPRGAGEGDRPPRRRPGGRSRIRSGQGPCVL